jgi:hypothetical protein
MQELKEALKEGGILSGVVLAIGSVAYAALVICGWIDCVSAAWVVFWLALVAMVAGIAIAAQRETPTVAAMLGWFAHTERRLKWMLYAVIHVIGFSLIIGISDVILTFGRKYGTNLFLLNTPPLFMLCYGGMIYYSGKVDHYLFLRKYPHLKRD